VGSLRHLSGSFARIIAGSGPGHSTYPTVRICAATSRDVCQVDMTSRVNWIGFVFWMLEFPEGDVAVNLDGGSS
uniref:hypothetical protein n=1 Tax=Paraburkholderia kururiensis TaxID=984307 RepID=UPI001F3DB42F